MNGKQVELDKQTNTMEVSGSTQDMKVDVTVESPRMNLYEIQSNDARIERDYKESKRCDSKERLHVLFKRDEELVHNDMKKIISLWNELHIPLYHRSRFYGRHKPFRSCKVYI